MTKFSLSVSALVIAATAGLVLEYQANHRLRQENRMLREQIARLQSDSEGQSKRDRSTRRAPRLPAPPMMPVAAEPAASVADNLQRTNLYSRWAKDPPRLTGEQVEAYLNANGRKASNLLAAYRTSGDAALLTQAMQEYPNDPQVAFEAVFKKDLSAEERRQWLNAFERNAPDNALPNYLSALDYFKAGQTDRAIQELSAASGKPQFQDYTLSRMQEDEEAYLMAGYAPAEAKMIGTSQVELPQLAQLKQLGLQMVELSKSYQAAGDATSAQAVLEMAVDLGQSYGGGSAGDCAISHLVGLVIERNALSAMDPTSPYGGSGRTVQDRLNEVTQQKSTIKSLFDQNERVLEAMSDQDWICYIDRMKSSGEEAAWGWVMSKHGQRVSTP